MGTQFVHFHLDFWLFHALPASRRREIYDFEKLVLARRKEKYEKKNCPFFAVIGASTMRTQGVI